MSAEPEQQPRPWGEKLAEQTSAVGEDTSSARALVTAAAATVRGRLSEILRHGIRPLLDEVAAQVRPATLEGLHARFPGASDDEIAAALTDRAAKTAGTVALAIGGVIVAQEAAAAAMLAVPPAAGTVLGILGVTALAEVLVLFSVEAKLRTDLNALAGMPPATPKVLVSEILAEVDAAGGWTKLRGRSLQRALPVAAARRLIARIVPLIPARFARVVIPEVIAPAVGAVWASRLASKQLRNAGQQHWQDLRAKLPDTTVTWGAPELDPPAPSDARS